MTTLPDNVLAELDALRGILEALEPLSRSDQARVMLVAITKYCPKGFTDAQLMQLVRIANTPEPEPEAAEQ